MDDYEQFFFLFKKSSNGSSKFLKVIARTHQDEETLKLCRQSYDFGMECLASLGTQGKKQELFWKRC